MGRLCWTVIGFLAIVWASQLRAEEPLPMSGYGNADNVVIKGCQQVSPAAIRYSLKWNDEFARVCRLSTSEFVREEALRAELLHGFHASGFPEAVVKVDWQDRQPPVVTVNEGPLYTCRDIRVTGLEDQLAADLTGSLRVIPRSPANQTPLVDPDSTDFVWMAGKHAPFDIGAGQRVRSVVQEELANRGWFFPVFNTALTMHDQDHTVTLDVKVERTGPPGVVRHISIPGLKHHHHSRAELLQFCQLQPGQAINAQRLAEIRQKLVESGRFWDVQVVPDLLFDTDDGISLTIQLVELENAPRVSEPLSELQQALLRFGRWVKECQDGNEELELEYATRQAPATWVKMVVNSSEGYTARVKYDHPAWKADHAVVISRASTAIFGLDRRVRMTASSPVAWPMLTCTLKPGRDAETGEWKARLVFGMGASTGHIQLEFDSLPVVFLREAVAPRADQWKLEQGKLIHKSDEVSLQIDAASGRLEQGEFNTETFTLRARTGSGLLAGLQEELHRACPEERRITSPSAFLIQELTAASGLNWEPCLANRRGQEVFQQILAPLDGAGHLWPESPEHPRQFWIPEGNPKPQFYAHSAYFNHLAGWLFPGGSFQWGMVRECSALYRGDGWGPELMLMNQLVMSSGPCSHLLLFRVFQAIAPTQNITIKKYDWLNRQGFERDIAPFLHRETRFGGAVLACADRVRQLNAEDYAALLAGTPELFHPFWARLRQHAPADESLDQATLQAFALYWDQGVSVPVTRILEPLLIKEPEPSVPPKIDIPKDNPFREKPPFPEFRKPQGQPEDDDKPDLLDQLKSGIEIKN